MKQTLIAVCVVLALITSGSTFVAVKFSNAASQSNIVVRRLQTEATTVKSKLDDSTIAEADDQKMIAFLQGETAKLRFESSNATAELFAAQEQARNLQNQLDKERQSNTQYLATVPKPKQLENGHLFFSQVCGRQGGILAENATFDRTLGTRVFFSLQDGTVAAFQGYDLHPLVLQYLGLNLDTLQANQSALDDKNDADRQKRMEQFVALQKQYAIQSQAANQIAIQQQKAADERAAKEAELQTERIKAQAAMVEAQKPPMQINVTQQAAQGTYVR